MTPLWKSGLRLATGSHPRRLQDSINLLQVGLRVVSLTSHKIGPRLPHRGYIPTHHSLAIHLHLLVQSTSQFLTLQISVHVFADAEGLGVLVADMDDLSG